MAEEKDIKDKVAKVPAKETKGVKEAKTETGAEGETEGKFKKTKKKSKKRKLLEAHVHIQASYNNTIITVSEMNGDAVCWASAGGCGFKGTRKATPYAASVTAETVMNKAKAMGVERVHISIKGIGAGRDQALRAINSTGVQIESLTDKTAVPHNGCRARKRRRV